jgi:hypothetical protein
MHVQVYRRVGTYLANWWYRSLRVCVESYAQPNYEPTVPGSLNVTEKSRI